MPQYGPGTSEQEFVALKAAMLELAQAGAFDANEAGLHVLKRGLTKNAGTIAAVLDDLVDLGELERAGRTEGIGAVRFQLPHSG